MPSPAPLATLNQRLQHLLEHLQHVLPAQAPIRDFVHHNTLHGFQHLPFPEALKAARQATGSFGYPSAATFREYYRNGRILPADLQAVLEEDTSLQANELLFMAADQPITRASIYQLILTQPITPITPNQFIWQIEEEHALERFQADVPANARAALLARAAQHGQNDEASAIGGLWAACLQALGLQHDQLHPEILHHAMPAQLSVKEQQLKQHARTLLDDLLGQVGKSLTLRGLLKALLGTDIMDQMRPQLLRPMALWLDQGLASWHTGQPEAGFYANWKQAAHLDWGGVLTGLSDWHLHLDSLPDDAIATIDAELRRMGIPEADWMGYLERLALELPGWSGMFLWRHQHPGYKGLATPVDMFDYLAVRLVVEHAFARSLCQSHWQIEATLPTIRGRFRRHGAEFMVRYYTFGRNLPEYLLTLSQQMIGRSQPGVYEDDQWQQLAHIIWSWSHSPLLDPEQGNLPLEQGWRLFRLAQHLGLDGETLRGLDSATLGNMLACTETLDEERAGYLCLQAYERHYREQLLNVLANNRQRGTWATRNAERRPQAQVIFCMDDREEGIRRHLEEVNPAIETLGAAAFFNLPINWRGLDDTSASKLCPVPVTPVHEVHEAAQPDAAGQKALHDQRHAQLLGVREGLHQLTRLHLASGTAISLLAAPLALANLLGKAFAPLAFNRKTHHWLDSFDPKIPTQVQFTATAEDPQRSAQHNQQGFTDQEQAKLVAEFLRMHGLSTGFAPLVVLMGHYSSNQNNPHQAAYGCGACSGRYSGPNARTFAAMANRPAIRALLAAEQVIIPDDCWFIGAEHDTCSEEIRWTDLDTLPLAFQAAFAQLRSDLGLAGQHSAHERCRKLVSAPRNPTLQQAQEHMAMRAVDYSQPRPELGHVTNAAALVGRRYLSQGAFFDRRTFLISYDYRDDPDGHILENLLLSVAPVGAGISLEYYFSTVSNGYYGSGSKITHNITGLFGVMDGGSGDLRTGLPKQMIEIHEPMRLLIVLEAERPILDAIYVRQPALRELIGNGWVQVAVQTPDTTEIHLFKPGQGFVRWTSDLQPSPVAARSADWYGGHSGHLPPALIGAGNPTQGGIAHV